MCRSSLIQLLTVTFSMFLHVHLSESKAVDLTESNFDKYIASHDVTFINFYADWCRFSQALAPIFEEAAGIIAQEFSQPGKVLFGKIDAVVETNLATRFKISKYPTLKLTRNGKLMKREYRGKRSVEGITDHIRELMKDPVIDLKSIEQMQNIDANKSALVIYLSENNSPIYDVYLKTAMDLRDDCQFYSVKGPLASAYLSPETNAKILFKPSKSKFGVNDEEYSGALLSYDELSAWSTNRCIPIVREITFENAEELTDEGLPFLILFHHPDDAESPKIYAREVRNQLLDDRTMVNFLTADGHKFAHPLHHVGKKTEDLPIIVIDSFRHMYLFPKFDDILVPGKLKEFVLDLFSGKLHREYHYGPDTPDSTKGIISTKPPESTFKKLAPSPNRYTLLRDEL